MKPVGHVLVSVGLGVSFGLASRSVPVAAAPMLVGVFMDLDHLPDFYRMFVQRRPNTNLLFLHGFELAAPLLAWCYLSRWDLLSLAITGAFLAHLVCDHLTNGMKPLYYFFTYRAWKALRREELCNWNSEEAYRDLLALPLGGRLLPHLVRWLRHEKGPPKGPGVRRKI